MNMMAVTIVVGGAQPVNLMRAWTSMGYFSNFDGKLNKMINSMFYKVASGWIGQLFGLDLKNVVLGVCIFTAAQVYSVKALYWLESNGTNTVSISHKETLDTDLEMWVAQQPSM
jgi:hypothetical protein